MMSLHIKAVSRYILLRRLDVNPDKLPTKLTAT